MFTTTTPQQIIDRARVRHWSFADLALGDGAVLSYLSQRLRTHLAMHGATIEGLVNTTMTYQLVSVAGLLIAEIAGVPQVGTTYQDGWPIHVDAFGVPYYDNTEPMVATDPYGLHGGQPGFPLPGEMVRLIDVSLTYSLPTGLTLPCDIIQEHGRIQAQPGRNPQAFVSGNRLVPMMPFTSSVGGANSADRWFNCQSILFSYVALPTLTRLSDFLNIPAVLVEALDADAALMMARQSKAIPAGAIAGFERDASTAAQAIASAGLEMIHEPNIETVEYRG